MTRILTDENMNILPPPDKQEIELEVAGHFHNGDIGNVARYVQRDKGIVSKQLSANCDDKNNVIYYFLLFLWAFDCIRRELGDAVIEIILRERRKWLDDVPTIRETPARLTGNIAHQLAEYVEAELSHKSYDEQIKELRDIKIALNAKESALINARNIEKFGVRAEVGKFARNGK